MTFEPRQSLIYPTPSENDLDILSKSFSVLKFSNHISVSNERIVWFGEKIASICSQLWIAFNLIFTAKQENNRFRILRKKDNLQITNTHSDQFKIIQIDKETIEFNSEISQPYHSFEKSDLMNEVIYEEEIFQDSEETFEERAIMSDNENKDEHASMIEITDGRDNIFQPMNDELWRFVRKRVKHINLQELNRLWLRDVNKSRKNSTSDMKLEVGPAGSGIWLLEMEYIVRKLTKRLLQNVSRLNGESIQDVKPSQSINIKKTIRLIEDATISIQNSKYELLKMYVNVKEIETLRKRNLKLSNTIAKASTSEEKVEKLEYILVMIILRRKIESFIEKHIFPDKDYQNALQSKSIEKQTYENALLWFTQSSPFNDIHHPSESSPSHSLPHIKVNSEESIYMEEQGTNNRNVNRIVTGLSSEMMKNNLWKKFEMKMGFKYYPALQRQVGKDIASVFDRLYCPNTTVRVTPQHFSGDIATFEVIKLLLTLNEDTSYPRLEWENSGKK